MDTSYHALRPGRSGGPVGEHRQDVFHLPALSASIAKARSRVQIRLREWGLEEACGADAKLLVSELFTNAVCHTDSVKVTCELRVDGDLLRLEVTDQGCAEAEPCVRTGDIEREGGRGLLLVGALSEAWGIRPAESGNGHVVWAELRHGKAAAPGPRRAG